MLTAVSKIYHSREDRIAELHDGNERIQYDGKDGVRITNMADCVDDYVSQFCDSCDQYIDSEDDREQEINRCNLIERWALAQAALSKAAWVMRLDGNIAYERMINALKTGAAVDMRGL